MSTDQELIQVLPSDGGLLLIGPETMLGTFDAAPEVSTRKLTTQMTSRAAKALGAASQLQASSGRWVKLDAQSAEWLKKHGVDTVTAGVVRGKDLGKAIGDGNKGSIAKHLSFEKAGLLTPAAPEVAAALAAQAAIEMALEDITAYLEEIDAKIDTLLRHRKIDVEAELVGVKESIDEAQHIFDATGTLSAVAYSKLEDNSRDLQTIQAKAIGHIRDNAQELEKLAGNPDKLVRATKKAQEDTHFWLQILAHALVLQDEQYVLELYRVADAYPEQLEAHTAGIRSARAQHMARLESELTRLLDSITQSLEMNNLQRVVNPLDAPRIHRSCNGVRTDVERFARGVGLEGLSGAELADTGWLGAAKGLARGTVEGAQSAGAQAAAGIGSAGRGIRRRADDGVLRLARRIESRRTSDLPDNEPRGAEAVKSEGEKA